MPSNSRIDLNHLTSYLHTTNSDCTTYKLIASSFATCITSRSSIVVVCITLSITIFYADRFKSARTSFNILLGLHGRLRSLGQSPASIATVGSGTFSYLITWLHTLFDLSSKSTQISSFNFSNVRWRRLVTISWVLDSQYSEYKRSNLEPRVWLHTARQVYGQPIRRLVSSE